MPLNFAVHCCLLLSLKTFTGQRPPLPVAMGTTAGGEGRGKGREGPAELLGHRGGMREGGREGLRTQKHPGSRGKCEFQDVLVHMPHNRSLWKEQNSFAAHPHSLAHTVSALSVM